MARRGRKRRLDVEAEYWRLLRSGESTVEACQQLGIGRKTGYRWRAENGGLPPERLPEQARSGRYLSLMECERIATLRERGLGVREIASRLGRTPSTVSRELERNTAAHDQGVYMRTWPTSAPSSGLSGRVWRSCGSTTSCAPTSRPRAVVPLDPHSKHAWAADGFEPGLWSYTGCMTRGMQGAARAASRKRTRRLRPRRSDPDLNCLN
ncbi:helix-turn-helix domain-containing protein [Streptomyces sp. NPDC048362]|uniref:helix-turn-helix domain-containing protein n=1 Tax=Streptomyces sp. NPDC048362 TaxID=3365539 RepID=UPI003723BE42